MAPKKNAAASPAPTPQSNIKPSQLSSASKTPTTSTPRNANDAQQILLGIYNNYLDQTPQRVKLIDAFMAFLVVVGVLQFVYCVLAGNYVSFPFPIALSSEDIRHSLTLCCWNCSPSTLSWPASPRLSANSSLQPACESRPTRRTRAILRGYHMRGMSKGSEEERKGNWHGELEHGNTDILGQGICRLRLREHDTALLLCQLHQLAFPRKRFKRASKRLYNCNIHS